MKAFFFSCRFDLCTSDTEEHSPVENLGQVVFGERIRPSPYKVCHIYVGCRFPLSNELYYEFLCVSIQYVDMKS